MNKYFELRNEYFTEPTTDTEYELFNNISRQLDDFFSKLNDDNRYIIIKPKARFLGYVNKQYR